MKTLFFIATLLSTHTFAADKKMPTPEEMTRKWQAYATPGAEHKMLSETAGTWEYTSRMWETPESKPQESKGVSTFKMILGGRYLQQEIKGQSMGMPHEGMGLTGFDNIKKTYETVWIDNMGTGLAQSSGVYDAATRTLKDQGGFTCPMTESKLTYRSEWVFKDKNNMIFSMYGTGPFGSKEYKFMEMVYKRTK